jgi:hypothetical protein
MLPGAGHGRSPRRPAPGDDGLPRHCRRTFHFSQVISWLRIFAVSIPCCPDEPLHRTAIDIRHFNSKLGSIAGRRPKPAAHHICPVLNDYFLFLTHSYLALSPVMANTAAK